MHTHERWQGEGHPRGSVGGGGVAARAEDGVDEAVARRAARGRVRDERAVEVRRRVARERRLQPRARAAPRVRAGRLEQRQQRVLWAKEVGGGQQQHVTNGMCMRVFVCGWMKRGQTTAGASQTRTSSSPVRSPTRSCSTRRVSSAAPHTGHAPLLLLLLSGVRGHCGHTATRARDGVAGASAYAASAQRKRPGTAAARTVATVLCGSVRSAGATSATISARNACGSGLRAGAAVAAGGGGVGSADAGVWCAQYASASATSQPAAVSRRATAGASAASTATLESTSCVISSISPSRIFALCTCPPPPQTERRA